MGLRDGANRGWLQNARHWARRSQGGHYRLFHHGALDITRRHVLTMWRGECHAGKLTVACSDWKPVSENTLVSFATIKIVELRLMIYEVAVHQKKSKSLGPTSEQTVGS